MLPQKLSSPSQRRWSHGYYPDFIEFPPMPVALSTAEQTAGWLLDHGYALAASNFLGVTGLAVEPALRDQVRLLDWFEDNVGRPRRTISSGMSMGGGIAVLLAERTRTVSTACSPSAPRSTCSAAGTCRWTSTSRFAPC
jgi:alpha/beta superfamily hydrolase